jgi:hypothetical protein
VQVVVFGIWVARLDWAAAAQRVREELIAHGEALELDSDEEAGTTSGYPSLPNSPGWHPVAGVKAGHKTPVYLPVTLEAQELEKEEEQQQQQQQATLAGAMLVDEQEQQRIVGSNTMTAEQQPAGAGSETVQAEKQEHEQPGKSAQQEEEQQPAEPRRHLRLRQVDGKAGSRQSSDDSQASDSPFAAVAGKPFGQEH